MPAFKNLTTGIIEIVENPETVEIMEASDSYEEVKEKLKKKEEK